VLMASVGRDRCGGDTRCGESFRRVQMEMEKAENREQAAAPPEPSSQTEERGAGSWCCVEAQRGRASDGKGDEKISARGESSWAKGCHTEEPATSEERARHVAEGEDARRGRT